MRRGHQNLPSERPTPPLFFQQILVEMVLGTTCQGDSSVQCTGEVPRAVHRLVGEKACQFTVVVLSKSQQVLREY